MSEQERPHKLRLLILSSTYPRWPNDAEPGFVHELAKRLTADFEVTALCPHAPGALHKETMDGVHVHRFRFAPARWETLVQDGGIVSNLRQYSWKWLLVPFFLVAETMATWRLCRRWRPEIIHAHWLLPQGLIAALLNLFRGGPPYLVTCHGVDLFGLRSRLFGGLKRFVLARAKAVTVVSEPMLDALAHLGTNPAKVNIQPMGVDLAGRFSPDPRAVRSPHELLFVGRLVEKKGLRHLITAMPEILRQSPTTVLSITGFGPEEAALKSLAKTLGVESKVHFLGPQIQEALPALYRRAAVFVSPFVEASSGDQEGLGLTMIEAAGCGCRLVLGDVPAIRSVFHAQPGVHLVNARDPAALANACLSALAEPLPGPGLREALCAQFDWTARAQAYSGILQSACGAQP